MYKGLGYCLAPFCAFQIYPILLAIFIAHAKITIACLSCYIFRKCLERVIWSIMLGRINLFKKELIKLIIDN